MKRHISLSEYIEAKSIVADYEQQEIERKLSIYDGCTKETIVSNEINTSRKKTTYFWVTKEKNIPDRNPEGSIEYDYGCKFYTLEHSHVSYKTYESAFKNLLKTFKRKGFIK